jgi:hypothetical protein
MLTGPKAVRTGAAGRLRVNLRKKAAGPEVFKAGGVRYIRIGC